MSEQLVIIGSGPAGHTAAIYTARANLQPFMFEGFSAGGIPGGQLMTTTEVENYPGFPKGVDGQTLMAAFREQSVRFGTRIVTEDAIRADLSKRPFVIASANQEVTAHALIIATGATARRLQLPGEKTLWNRGISACAVCDGALPLFRNKPLVVVGGGDSACEEAGFLTKFASKVYLVHRRDQLRASKIMQERVLKNPKIEVVWNTVLVDVLGSDAVSAVRLKDVKTNRQRDLPCGGLFYAIGFDPNTAIFRGQLKFDGDGYIVTEPGTTRTSVDGVFACGDVQDKHYRQAITAAGSGCMAALDAERWLADHGVH
ncbi:MAG: thioredoxin-disulfide reductase [Candidatus Omnitrophica bacterium CG11_big_fil_rev_8_21_14_0_20_63_9]|nr:MAG: thioredoxin-disulfide reductase [Candidatus Omnitrophica bacterium CG11_big_fil_rev_8_21_14_0_20_63_9]